jgi:hypothetical protein
MQRCHILSFYSVRAVKGADIPKPEDNAPSAEDVFVPPVITEVFVVSACTAPLFKTARYR